MEEFFSIALALETDAAERYTESSRILRADGHAQLAILFDQLAVMKRDHASQVEKWALQNDVVATSSPPWPIPETFDVSPEEAARSSLTTPYRVLAAAVRHEQRAFAFWTYVAAHSERDDIRIAAENMAREELEHASLLRRERRTAYHSERSEAAAVMSLTTLACLERKLADLLDHRSESAADYSVTEDLAARSRACANTLEQLAASHRAEVKLVGLRPDQETTQALSEFLVEAYLQLADTSDDEHILDAAQGLAATAINRLGTLDSEHLLAKSE